MACGLSVLERWGVTVLLVTHAGDTALSGERQQQLSARVPQRDPKLLLEEAVTSVMT